jgi:hypothetical protein
MGEWGDREVGKFQLILQNPKTPKPQLSVFLLYYFPQMSLFNFPVTVSNRQ